MAVAKYKRKESKFEVIDKFLRIRKYMTFYIMKDFGIKGKMTKVELMFLTEERSAIIETMRNIMIEINLANNIYVTNYVEYEQRRLHQDNAISYMVNLYGELQYVIDVFKQKEKEEKCILNQYKKHKEQNEKDKNKEVIDENKEANDKNKKDDDIKEKELTETDKEKEANEGTNKEDENKKDTDKKEKKKYKRGYYKFNININKYATLLTMMNEEIKLLRAWRKSENPVGKKYRDEANNLFEMNEHRERIKEEMIDKIVEDLNKPQDLKFKFKKKIMNKLNDK